MREAGAGHDLSKGDIFKTMPIEESAGAFDDPFSDRGTMTGRIGH
jgi:hypothetical protein